MSNSPKVLASFPHEMEAGAMVNILADHGIQAELSGEMVAGFRAEVPGDVKILVPEHQLETARRVLLEVRSPTPEAVDWSQVDVGEPIQEVAASIDRSWLVLCGSVLGILMLVGLLWSLWLKG